MILMMGMYDPYDKMGVYDPYDEFLYDPYDGCVCMILMIVVRMILIMGVYDPYDGCE